jgi:Tfp pilus assembly protein PilN
MKPSQVLSMLVAISASIFHPDAGAADLDAEQRLLEQVAAFAPAGVEVRSVNIEQEQVRIEGRCDELSRVAELLRRIEESDELHSPILRSLERGSDGQLTFQIASSATPRAGCPPYRCGVADL